MMPLKGHRCGKKTGGVWFFFLPRSRRKKQWLISEAQILSIRREVTVFFYQSDVKEASGMLNIHFGLALIDTYLIEEAFSKTRCRYWHLRVMLDCVIYCVTRNHLENDVITTPQGARQRDKDFTHAYY